MLSLSDVHTYYGRSHVLQGVDLEVGQGETVALLGRNGAGKTTTLRSIVGLTPARKGRIAFSDRDITRLATHKIARAGVAFVPSGRRIFSSLSVRQNLLLVQKALGGKRGQGWSIEQVYGTFPKLGALDSRRAGFLSGGEQQMLKLGRALVANPRMLLLDELTEGLAPAVVGDLAGWLTELKEQGLSMLICEQNALFALDLAQRAYILDKGRIRHQGSAEELRDSDEIRQYLGV